MKQKFKVVMKIEMPLDQTYGVRTAQNMIKDLATYWYRFGGNNAAVLDLKVKERKCRRPGCREWAVTMLLDWNTEPPTALRLLLEYVVEYYGNLVGAEVHHMTDTRIRT